MLVSGLGSAALRPLSVLVVGFVLFEFVRRALDALQWLTDGGPGPLTADAAHKPVTVRAVVHELAAAEAAIYGRRPTQRDYARGVEHALMWAQYATAAPPVPCKTPTIGENA